MATDSFLLLIEKKTVPRWNPQVIKSKRSEFPDSILKTSQLSGHLQDPFFLFPLIADDLTVEDTSWCLWLTVQTPIGNRKMRLNCGTSSVSSLVRNLSAASNCVSFCLAAGISNVQSNTLLSFSFLQSTGRYWVTRWENQSLVSFPFLPLRLATGSRGHASLWDCYCRSNLGSTLVLCFIEIWSVTAQDMSSNRTVSCIRQHLSRLFCINSCRMERFWKTQCDCWPSIIRPAHERTTATSVWTHKISVFS